MLPKKRKRVPWGWIWAGAAVAAGAGCGMWYHQITAAEAARLPAGVQTGTATRENIDQKITATGVAAAQTGAKVNIGSQITGRISRLPADVGTVVRAGQVVAVLDAPDLQAQVDQQQQSVSVSAANLRQVESRFVQAQLSAALSREQTVAQIDEARHALTGAEQHLRVTDAQRKLQPVQTTSDIAHAEATLSTVRSQERQVKQTVALQLTQAQTAIDDAREALANARLLLRRQRALLAQGYIAGQQVDDTRTLYLQASAHLKNAEASYTIVQEKTEADLAAARDRVTEAEAALNAARAGRLQDAMREADQRTAEEARKQAAATLALRNSNRTQDLIRRRAEEEARSAVEQARASFRQAEALLNYQKAQLDKAIIHSPIDGTVLSITAQQGETVAAGFSAPTLITVADLHRLEIRTYVDEVDIGKVHRGLPAEVRVEAYPNRVFHGHVTKMAAASTMKDNVVTYETTVAVTDAGGLLRPDMTASVTLILGRTPNVLSVPTEAVHRAVGRSVLYVLHRDRKGKERVEERTVRTGVQDTSRIEIADGVREQEEVILAGLQRLGVTAVDAQSSKGKAK